MRDKKERKKVNRVQRLYDSHTQRAQHMVERVLVVTKSGRLIYASFDAKLIQMRNQLVTQKQKTNSKSNKTRSTETHGARTGHPSERIRHSCYRQATDQHANIRLGYRAL